MTANETQMDQNHRNKTSDRSTRPRSGSALQCFLEFDRLSTRETARLLEALDFLHRRDFVDVVPTPPEELWLRQAVTGSSLLLEVWSEISQFAPDVVNGLKAFVSSALGLKILHDWEKLRLTRAKRRLVNAQAAALEDERGRSDAPGPAEASPSDTSPDEAVPSAAMNNFIEVLSSTQFKLYLVVDRASGSAIVARRESLAEEDVQAEVDAFKYWISHYRHSVPSHNAPAKREAWRL